MGGGGGERGFRVCKKQPMSPKRIGEVSRQEIGVPLATPALPLSLAGGMFALATLA